MGFSNRSYLLQIIPGSLVLAAIIIVFVPDYSKIYNALNSNGPVMLLPFLFVAFILGALLDLLADIAELLLYRYLCIRQPSRNLLCRGEIFGIKLPHYQTIRNKLIEIVIKHSDCPEETANYFNREARKVKCGDVQKGLSLHEKIRKKLSWIIRNLSSCRKKITRKDCKRMNTGNAKANHLFQAARSIAFRECNDHQIEQIEAYFSLYIFSRNTCLCLFIISVMACFAWIPENTSEPETNAITIIVTAVPFTVGWFPGILDETQESETNIITATVKVLLFCSSAVFWLAYYRFKVYYSRSVLEAIYEIR